MTINDIKLSVSKQLGVTLGTLDIHAQKNVDGTINPDWVSAWIDSPRARISMHREIFDKIMSDRTFAGLAVKAPVTVVPTSTNKDGSGKEPYQRFVVITPESILASF